MGCDDISDAQRAWLTGLIGGKEVPVDEEEPVRRHTLVGRAFEAQRQLQHLLPVMVALDEWVVDPDSRILSTRLQQAVRDARGH